MNTPVSFPIAKLLKEKGFERNVGYSKPYYNHLGELNGDVTEYVRAQIHDEDTTPFETTPVPTIAEVVMWLYEKHGIWIFSDRTNKWFWTIEKPNSEYIHQEDLPLTEKSIYNGFDSPTEAYEAAIKYTLNNLI